VRPWVQFPALQKNKIKSSVSDMQKYSSSPEKKKILQKHITRRATVKGKVSVKG
jgi:hypothetical protein